MINEKNKANCFVSRIAYCVVSIASWTVAKQSQYRKVLDYFLTWLMKWFDFAGKCYNCVKKGGKI